ncbi:MAG: 30S ribosomal protein S3, partial [Planctomycetes bacterium]|nr:30S ribosomal protein S3 [Planctomycetota bacterium]
LRADIDYSSAPARTIYGAIGVKVWIYRGEIFDEKDKKSLSANKKAKSS